MATALDAGPAAWPGCPPPWTRAPWWTLVSGGPADRRRRRWWRLATLAADAVAAAVDAPVMGGTL